MPAYPFSGMVEESKLRLPGSLKRGYGLVVTPILIRVESGLS